MSKRSDSNQGQLFGTEAVDAVITWVDGEDPEHVQRRISYADSSARNEKPPIPTGATMTRFIDNGELDFCIRSIRLFAPWIRTIYLVTDGQCPPYLTPEKREKFNIRLVDHTEIFRGYEWALPTFNSRTIETVIWRIEGLSERFIYFNDDILLARPVEKSELFRGDQAVLRGHWNRIGSYGPLRLKYNRLISQFSKSLFGITRSMHHLLQMRSAELAGLSDRYYRFPHLPRPIRKSTLEAFFEENPEILEENIVHRFRNHEQFSSVFLGSYLDIVHDRAFLREPTDYTMVNGEVDLAPMIRRKIRKVETGDVNFLTLQGIERLRDAMRDELYARLESYMNLHDPEGHTHVREPGRWRGLTQ